MEQQRDKGKDFKNGEGGKLGQGVGALKRKGLEPLTKYVDNLWQALWYIQNSSTDRIGQASCKTFLKGNTQTSRKLGTCQ